MGKPAVLSVRIVSLADNRGFKKAVRDIKAFTTRVKAMDKHTSPVAKTFDRMATTVGSVAAPLARLGAIAGGATVAVGGLAPAVAGVAAAAGHALAPLASLTAALAPSALGAGAAAIGTLKLAFDGMGDALTAADPEAFADALDHLTPAAQDAAITLSGLKDMFDEVGASVQEAFWANLSNLGDLSVLIDPIAESMTGLAADMGNVAAGLVDFVTTGTGLAATEELISNSGLAASFLADAIGSALQGIIAVGAAASPIFVELTEHISQAAAAWSDRMVAAFADGSLEEYLRGAIDTLREFWEVIVHLGGIVSGVFHAMTAAGQPFLGSIGQAIEATHLWVASAEGMATLTDFFSAMGAAVAAVLPIIGQLAGIIGATLAPVIADMVTTVAPALSTIVGVLGEILAAVSPIIAPLADIVGLIGTALADAMGHITPIVATLARLLADGLTHAFIALQPVMPIITNAIGQLADMMAPLMPLVGDLIEAFVELIPPIAELAGIVIPPLVEIIRALMPVLEGIIKGVISFFHELQPLIDIIGQLAGPVLGALASVLKVIGPILGWVAEHVTRLGLEVLTNTKIMRVLHGVFDALKWVIKPVVWVFDEVASAIRGVCQWVANLIDWVSHIRWPSPPGWVSELFGSPTLEPFPWITPTTIGAGGGMMLAAATPNSPLRSPGGRAQTVHVDNSITINVDGTGIVDAREVADKIRQVFRTDQRNRGLPTKGLVIA